jgi:prepilin-type N-terminal cleavage/methylation domain-containing protein
MKQRRNSQSERAFTLIEMLFAMTILAIVLGLTLAEFTAAIQNFRFEDAHLDAETQGRVAMARINDAMKLATPDIEDNACSQLNTCSVIPASNGPGLSNSVDGNTAVSFYVVTSNAGTSGHLSKTMPTNGSHEPIPSYNVETVFYNAPNLLQECTETIAQYNAEPNPLTTPCQNSTTGTQTIVHNVDGSANVPFGVTPLGCQSTDTSCSNEVLGLQIDISIVNQANQVLGNTGSSTSGGVAERASVSNEIFFSSWKAFH